MSKLTMARARAITEAGRYPAGDTLYLQVTETGQGVCKSWLQRLTINGRRRDIGLGSFKLVNLTEARELAFDNRRAVRLGSDPLAEKHKPKVPTFREAAQEKYKDLLPTWKRERTGQDWMRQLEKHAMKRLGRLPVDKITRADVLAVLGPIWHEKPSIAKCVRRHVRAVLKWCEAHGHIEVNYAGAAIDGALSKNTASVKRQNHAALPYAEIPAALEAVRNTNSSRSVKACIEFTVLTACRNIEARGATWSEVDLDKRLWTIPAERMKRGIEHRQPISAQAAAVLTDMKALQDDSELVFPSPQTGGVIAPKALANVLRRIGLGDRATMHGFRTGFRTWASEQTNADHAVMELCLAHAVGDQTVQAYARSDLLAKRARLMDQWGAFATRTPGTVTHLHTQKGDRS